MKTCGICNHKKPYIGGNDDEVWYQDNENNNSLMNICWDCALKTCIFCKKEGTWYQKHEMGICDDCYVKETTTPCVCSWSGDCVNENHVMKCLDCNEYRCSYHLNNGKCEECE